MHTEGAWEAPRSQWIAGWGGCGREEGEHMLNLQHLCKRVSWRRDCGSGAQEGSLSCRVGERSMGEELRTRGLVEVILGGNGE